MASPPAKIQKTTDNIIAQSTLTSKALVSTPGSKRTLSNTSTPSPSACIQVTKKAKVPVSNHTIIASDLNPTNQETASIVLAVMEQISERLKTTIADHVQDSVMAMANSVVAIITSLNDSISTVKLENKNLRDQITSLSDKIKILESCLRISGIHETPEENTDDLTIKLAQACDTQLT